MKEFKLTETFGMGIANPGKVMKVTGDPKFIEALVKYFEEEDRKNEEKEKNKNSS